MWLTNLKLFWVVTTAVPKAAAADADATAKAAAQAKKAKWDEANQACLSRLLNALSNRLFDVYSGKTSAKELWDELKNEFSEADNGNEFHYRKLPQLYIKCLRGGLSWSSYRSFSSM